MSKKSRERRALGLLNRISHRIRIHDLVMLAGWDNGFDYGGTHFNIQNAKVIDIANALPPDIIDNSGRFNVSGDRIASPVFENMFLETKHFPWFPGCGLGVWIIIQESGDESKNKWNGLMFPFLCSYQHGVVKKERMIGRFWLNSDGSIDGWAIEDDETGKVLLREDEDQLSIEERVSSQICARAMSSAFYGLTLLNCRNIELVDHEPDTETSREYERHFGQPLTKYKTLVIKQKGKRYESGDPQPYQDLMPLHLRRGNFAHYTEDAPLFGKYTGTFWRPATVVGSEKNGVVVKDYKVEAPGGEINHEKPTA